jgi:hypothetical protein
MFLASLANHDDGAMLCFFLYDDDVAYGYCAVCICVIELALAHKNGYKRAQTTSNGWNPPPTIWGGSVMVKKILRNTWLNIIDYCGMSQRHDLIRGKSMDSGHCSVLVGRVPGERKGTAAREWVYRALSCMRDLPSFFTTLTLLAQREQTTAASPVNSYFCRGLKTGESPKPRTATNTRMIL